MKRLVVISGGFQTGKMPLARVLMAEDGELVLVHRDALRMALETLLDEAHLTYVMHAIADELLRLDHSPLIVAWNLEPIDREIWTGCAGRYGAPLVWMDVHDPTVAARIPVRGVSDG